MFRQPFKTRRFSSKANGIGNVSRFSGEYTFLLDINAILLSSTDLFLSCSVMRGVPQPGKVGQQTDAFQRYSPQKPMTGSRRWAPNYTSVKRYAKVWSTKTTLHQCRTKFCDIWSPGSPPLNNEIGKFTFSRHVAKHSAHGRGLAPCAHLHQRWAPLPLLVARP